MNAAPGRWLDQAGRIADRKQAVGIGAVDRAQGQNLEARRKLAVRDAPAVAHALEHPAVAARRIARGHDADAHEEPFRPHDGHGPGKPTGRHIAAEMQLHRRHHVSRQFALRGMQIGARQAEPEALLEGILRSARQNRQARLHDFAADGSADTGGIGLERDDPRARADLSAGGERAIGKGAIEGRAIDDRCDRRGRRVVDRDAPRRDEPHLGQMIQCGGKRKIEAAEAVRRQHARAMDRIADPRVFLADNGSNAPAGEPCGHEQAARASAHNQDVYRIKHSTGAL